MPFALIPFLLLIVPIIEIAAFIAIGGQIGIGLTLLMILVTAIIGSILLRVQGMHLIRQIQAETEAGRIPGRALGHGFLMLVAGILLLTPGFVTDAIGFLLFVPFVRDAIWSFAKTRIHVVAAGRTGMGMGGMGAGGREEPPRRRFDETVIDLDEDEYSTVKNKPTSGASPWKPDS